MGFLPIPSDDDLAPEARAAAAAFLAEHGGELTPLDRALLSAAPAFDGYLGWFRLRDELVPFLGERAVALFGHAISQGLGAPFCVDYFRGLLTEAGDDPDAPQVTEAEALLIAWGRAIGATPAAVPADLLDRVAATFQPRLRALLTAWAGLMVAVGVFTLVGGVAAD
jgi:hypothetical protein